MTVGELRGELNNFPDDTPIYVFNEAAWGDELTSNVVVKVSAEVEEIFSSIIKGNFLMIFGDDA